MKNWKSLLITVFSFFAIGSLVFLNSCVKDPCSDLKCTNGGSCSDGFCQCPTGYEGAECEIPSSTRFTGTWVGSVRCNNFPIQADTVRITVTKPPNQITMNIGAGNTVLINYTGINQTPETDFTTIDNDTISVHTYVREDGGLMQLYIQTIDKRLNTRQNCYFSGSRVAY